MPEYTVSQQTYHQPLTRHFHFQQLRLPGAGADRPRSSSPAARPARGGSPRPAGSARRAAGAVGGNPM